MLLKKNSSNTLQKGWSLLTCLIIAALLMSGCAASKPKVYRVGILNDNASFSAIGAGFKSEMTTLVPKK